jgi:hypothetical protein
MGCPASSMIVLLVGGIALPVLADEPHTLPWTTTAPVTEPPTEAARPATKAVASFPDVVPNRAPPPVDPALELLASDPYEAQLMAIKIAVNLYGGVSALEDPYAEERRLANPYTDHLRVAHSGSDSARFENPYSASLRLANPDPDSLRFDNPYSALRR